MKSNFEGTKVDWKKLAGIEVSQFEQDLIHNQRWSVEEIGTMIAYSFIDSEFVSISRAEKLPT